VGAVYNPVASWRFDASRNVIGAFRGHSAAVNTATLPLEIF